MKPQSASLRTNRFAAILTIAGSTTACAAAFTNLGFDDGQTPVYLPGWDTVQPVGKNVTPFFEDRASILDVNYRNTRQPANPAKVPVVGQFSLGIWPYSGNRFAELPFILKQTGDIPADAQSLRFLYVGNNLKVSVGGSERLVHFTENRPSGDPEISGLPYYIVDVSPFAGQTVELRFDFFSFGNYPGQDGGPIPGWPDAKFHVLDDLTFSPLPAVPEPQTWALFGVGLGAVLWFGRKRA